MSLTSEQLQRLRTLQGALSALSHEYEDVIPLIQSAVKDGNDTAIGMLKDQTNGLAAIKTAIGSINIDTSDLAKQGANPNTSLTVVDNKIGTAPVGSDKATLFAWLTTIYEYLAGQTPEEIPESLGDRINFLLQFFGLPQALPEYQSMTVAEVTDYLEEIMQNIDPDLTAEDAAAITEEVLSSDSSDDSSD